MKFIRELLANKGRSDGSDDLDEADVRRGLEDAGYGAPLAKRGAGEQEIVSDDDAWDEFSGAEFADLHPERLNAEAAKAQAPGQDDATKQAWVDDLAELENDDGWLDDSDDDDDWDIGPESTLNDAHLRGADNDDGGDPAPSSVVAAISSRNATKPNTVQTRPRSVMQFEGDDDVDADEVAHSDAHENAAMNANPAQDEVPEGTKEMLVDEIRDAMHSARNVRTVEEMDRQAAAREQLGIEADGARNSRILDATNSILDEDTGARRRQSIALMKNAAAATKTDPVLQKLASTDHSIDPLAQSTYREDLASFTGDQRDPSFMERARTKERPASQLVAPKVDAQAEADDPFGADQQPLWAHKAVADETSVAAQLPDDLDGSDGDRAVSQSRVDNLRAALMAAPKSRDVADEATYEGEELEQPNSDIVAPISRDLAASMVADDDETPEEITLADEPPLDIQEIDIADALTGLNNEPATADEDTSLPAPEGASIGLTQDMSESAVQVPPPTMGRAGRRAGRVKTRLLGFQTAGEPETDLFSGPAAGPAAAGSVPKFPLGWIVVVDGPGRGASFTLTNGVCQIGRGTDQAVALDFGDTSISRQNHAAIAYDDEQNTFFLGHGGKSNLVRLNGKPVLSTEELSHDDRIRLGETTLQFVALCAGDFSWKATEDGNEDQSAIA